jgi:signal transduction histidine kinase
MAMRKLWVRLSLSFLLVTWLAIGLAALLIRGAVVSGFDQYVASSEAARFGPGLVEALEAYYAANGTWAGADDLLAAGRGHGEGAGGGDGGGANAGERGAQAFVAGLDGIVAAASRPDLVGQPVADVGSVRMLDLVVNGAVVGALGAQTPGAQAIVQAEQRFLEDTSAVLGAAAILGGVLAFAAGLLVAYSLTRPLARLTESIARWRPDGPQAPVPITGTEEIQRLGRSFNALLARLAAGEALRRRMAADVAHELRTPLTVMRGHTEAMLDGVYPLDAEHIAVVHDQTLHLGRLVEDLRLLTLAEAGQLDLHPQPVDLHTLLDAAVQRFAPLVSDAGLRITVALASDLPPVLADPQRLQQVIDNLLGNAVQYTPGGGRIAVEAREKADGVHLTLRNPAPDLSQADVASLFDRFWRAEDARGRASGGSGLGLAIAQELLRIQRGRISASLEAGDLALALVLPVAR